VLFLRVLTVESAPGGAKARFGSLLADPFPANSFSFVRAAGQLTVRGHAVEHLMFAQGALLEPKSGNRHVDQVRSRSPCLWLWFALRRPHELILRGVLLAGSVVVLFCVR
jgi:hypothetical protein